MRTLFVFLAVAPLVAIAAPHDAERFTHLAGVNLSELPALEDLQKRFGASPITESGDAGDSDARVCYRTSDGRAAVEFFRGEVNWGFVLRLPKPKEERCPASKALDGKDLSISGIRLGMEESAYRQLMGKPSKEVANRLEHYFEYVHILTDAELVAERHRWPATNPEELRRWDVGISIRASFGKGRLVSFTVDRVETN
jgi:hypothetical protein